jgi:hypothetical protein
MLTLFGLLGDHPPRDPDGFAAFARSLRFPDIYDAIADAEPIDAPVTYRFVANTRRRYERMRRLPDGFLVIGDAICSFNPIYGQGMTVAALQALALREHLPTVGHDTPRVFGTLARAIEVPWQLATGADLALPEVEGSRPPRVRLLNRYVGRLQAAATCDAALSQAFLRVTSLVDRPETLLRPSVVGRVVRANVRPRPISQSAANSQSPDASSAARTPAAPIFSTTRKREQRSTTRSTSGRS